MPFVKPILSLLLIVTFLCFQFMFRRSSKPVPFRWQAVAWSLLPIAVLFSLDDARTAIHLTPSDIGASTASLGSWISSMWTSTVEFLNSKKILVWKDPFLGAIYAPIGLFTAAIVGAFAAVLFIGTQKKGA